MVRTLCIVGGGFSGAMTAANALCCARKQGIPLRVTLIEKREQCGLGVAYSTRCDDHVLNVPCARMSAYPDRPDHFLDWARQRAAGVDGGKFLPRKLFGEYVSETLKEAASDAGGEVQFEIVRSEATSARRISHPGSGPLWRIECANGHFVDAESVVLALGHRPPGDPVAQRWTGSRARWIGDPWGDDRLSRISPDEPVAVLGSGLTAVDVVLSLAGARDREGPTRIAPMWLVSRRGLLPAGHAPSPGVASAVDVASRVQALLNSRQELTVRQLLRCVRASVLAVGTENWRLVIDALRPLTQTIWRALPEDERVVFMRRVRPFWEVHRHRMAPHVAERMVELRRRGVVRIIGGRVEDVRGRSDGLCISMSSKDSNQHVNVEAAWLINCTGPGAASTSDTSPLIASLLGSGEVRVDSLNLGLLTSADGACVNTAGVPQSDLHVVGTLRKPDLWETTAVPELRVQASEVAKRVVAAFALQTSRPDVQVRTRPSGDSARVAEAEC